LAKGLWRRRRFIRNFLLGALAFTLVRVAELGESRQDAKDAQGAKDNEAANARKITAATDGLVKVVAGLRQLEPSAASRVEVDKWLDNWDAFIAVGRNYAAALRTGDPSKYQAIAKRGEAPATAIRTFARANRIDKCNGSA